MTLTTMAMHSLVLNDLGIRVLKAQKIHEESWVPGDELLDHTAATFGKYTKDNMQAAIEACDGEDGFEAQLIYYLNECCWNDIQEWAHLVQGKNYVFNEVGDYSSPDGKIWRADGTEIIDDFESKVTEG